MIIINEMELLLKFCAPEETCVQYCQPYEQNGEVIATDGSSVALIMDKELLNGAFPRLKDFQYPKSDDWSLETIDVRYYSVQSIMDQLGIKNQQEAMSLQTCPTCGGSGEISHEIVDFFDEKKVSRQKCPECNGWGEVPRTGAIKIGSNDVPSSSAALLYLAADFYNTSEIKGMGTTKNGWLLFSISAGVDVVIKPIKITQ